MEDQGIAEAVAQLQQADVNLKREFTIEHFVFGEDEDQMADFAEKAKQAGWAVSDIDYIDPEEEDEEEDMLSHP